MDSAESEHLEMECGSVFWHSLLPDGAPVAVRDAAAPPASAHTVVVGASVSGLACARELAELVADGQVVVALDARGLADGAAGRNGGHQFAERVEPGDPQHERLAAIERHDVQEVRKLVAAAATKARIAAEETGGIKLSFDAAQEPFMRDYADKAEGGDVEFVDGDQLRQRGWVGAPAAACAAYVPDAGQIFPGGLVLELADQARQRGAQIFTGYRVVGIDEADEGRWRVRAESVEGGACEVVAQHVVYAGNGYGLELLPERLRGVMKSVRGQCVAARAPAGLAPKSITYACEEGSNHEYLLQRRQDGVIIFGGCRHLSPNKGLDCDDSTVDAVVTERLCAELARLFPGAPVQVSHAWCGIMCFTADEQPLVGRIKERPGQFVCAGYTGHGMVRAFSCGRHVAQLIAGSAPSCPAIDEAFSPDRASLFADKP